MPTPDKIDQLYDALKADGAVSKSRENFRSYMLASGEQGYRNRKQLYDALKADGAVESATYEEFRDRLGLHAVKPQQPVTKPSSTPRSAQQPSKPQKAKQQPKKTAWKPTWQEKMGMQMQLDKTMRQVKQSQQDFNTRMENIRKGNTLGKTSEVKFNPESGKMERRYYTTHGDEVTTPLEQSLLNLKYRDEWEATTPEGRKHREKRIENDFERRVGASLDKYDPDNAAAMVWQQAEDKSNEEFGRYLDERSKPSWSNFLRGAAEGTSVTGGLGADNVDTGIKAFATHLKYHDLQRMADDAWNMLGKEKQQSIIEDMYGALKNRYPQATEQQLQQAATEMAREQSDRRMYELAVAKNAPKDAAEYFIRKVAAGNAMGTLMQAAARAQAGTTGDWEAREDAEQRFEKQGHKVAGIAGTVTGFALDPLTWASAGAGGAAVKGTTWLGGKMIGEAAMRKFGTTLGGRMLGGAIGGAVNFGTYEAGSEALDQMKWGGYIDEETGERKDGFSFGNVAGRAGHGLMMGAVTGVIAPYLGNVSDKLVRATESTVGKMGIRAGELGVGTVAEGTIFAVPEIINTYGQYGDLINSLSDESSPNYIADEQERAAKIEELRNSRGDALMDVWTDNMAMIAGFKAQHLLKSAPRVIYDLARSKNGKAGFETRLRSILDGRGDLALTEDEKKELERRGYGDLKDLTEEYSRYAEAKEEYDKARPTTTDASRMIEGGDGQAELPYNRFVELMTDNSVSEAARAKMYYYLTGHGLPMSTVMGSSILEDKDADGNVTGYTVQSFGANGVITSRSFGDKKRADVEVNRINRQAELNGFDVGERYYDWQGDNKRMYEACETVAEETGAPANLLFDLMKRKTEAMNEVELEWAEKILNTYNGLGDKYGLSEVRTAINEEFGVDVDKAICKERNRRSEQEQKAVDEYASRLFADVKRKQEEAAERGEAPVDPDAPTSNSQIAALLGIDDGEQGDPVSAAFNRGHEADAQERQDIAIELTDPNNSEAQEAWNGVVQRINEDAAYMVAQQREQTKQMQHTDGSLRPAILKEKDSEGNDQQVYIVDGNVQMMPDGSVVDKASSDNIVVIYNPATGERKQIDPSADTGISSLGEVTTAEQREADIERSRQEYIQAQIDEAQGTVRFVPGQQLVLPTGEEAVVVATDADGENITVALGDGTQATVQRSELQRIRDEKASADYRQRHGITEEPAAQQPEASAPAQPQTDGRVAGAPADYTADMELTIRDEDGSEKPAMVMGRVRYENGSFVPDANGNIIEYFMDGEVKHDHEDKLVDKVVSHVAPQQPEAAPVQEASAETPATVETTPPPVEQQAEVAPQPVQEPVQTVEPQPAQPAEAPAQPTEQPTAEPMPMREVGTGKNAETEPDWMAVTPERGHDWLFGESGLDRSDANEIVTNNLEAAQKAVDKASKLKPKKTTNPFTLQAERERIAGEQEAAQNALDYWKTVQSRQTALRNAELEQSRAEQAERDRIAHEQAVAEAQAEYEARKQAEAERKAVGNENPMPAITEKWNNATKVDGHRDEIMLPDGTPLKGHYVLHESGASSPSHNPETWQKTDGFPMDANDNSVNDRDYERDHDAQEHTQSIARQYDQRALQSVPVVSNDGVVLSGNGRTMAGELAARDNTDGAYVNYLKEYAPKFGFTAEQVGAMQHPRVSFVPDEAMPYTAETFAKFNQQEMKSQNKTEQAVKLGKTVNDDSFKGIVRTINGYDTLGDFYNDAEASLGAVYDLHNAGVVPQAQLAEMVDGVRGQEKLSAVGREFLENMLIGKAFEGDPEVVRMLTAEPAMRQTVITALGEIVDNIALGGDWSLQGELADAVKLCFDARQGGAKYGEIVSTYARQGVLFADPDELQTVADFNNATMLMLADVLNDKRVTLLKTTLQLYNNNARQSASGQTDLFVGGIQSREDILRDVITFINENYGKRKEIEAARAEAVERRKAESVQQDGTPPAVNNGSEDTGRSERSEEEIARMTHDEAITLIAQMEERADVAPDVELTIENWDAQFGEDGRVNTPIGDVKMGENQFTKLMRQGREGKLGMIKPTLETPDVIIEDASEAKEDDVEERNSSYVFVKAFKKADGSRYYYFTSVTVSKDGKEVVISNQEKRKNAIANLLTNGKLVWKHADDVSAASDVEQGFFSSQGNMSDPTTEGTDAPQTNVLSAGKVSEKSSTVQEKTEKVAENQTPNAVQTALAAAEQETNTEPTEAQKEAGNYKKGHVKIDGYDVTIENPKGSVRRGTDASGKQWEQEMQNTYGYIRGTEGVDGDHIDVFFSDDPSQGNVFVVDQVNKDGSFDEHKVMYGFPDIESARKAYLSNYEDGWQGLGAITPVSKDEFKKWTRSSHRKTKPFAEYSSVKPLGDTQLGEQPNKPTVKAGEDYVSAAERIAKENEVKRTAAHFAEETQEEAAAFDKRVPEIDDAELLAYMQEDGMGDVNKAHHPSVYDEYDYRHGEEQLQSYDDTLVRLNESSTTLEQAEEMLANIHGNMELLATEERPLLLGQEEALQEYIDGLKNVEKEKEVAKTSQRTVHQELQSEIGLSEKEQSRLSELKSMGRSNLSRRELDEMLSLERKERILREGTSFDAPFGLKPVSKLSDVADIDSNIGKIVGGLKRHEGDGTFGAFEGFAYQGAYKKNAGHQVDVYLTGLTGVVPDEILKSWADGHGLKTRDDVLAYGERLYDEAKVDVTEPQPIGKGMFEYFKGTLNELVEIGKKAGNVLQKMVLVPTVSERLKTDLSSMGIVLDVPYRHTIDNFAIKHTFNEHASEDEKLRGQVPITESDFHLATDVIENYDEISIDKNKRGQHIILYKKQYPDGRIIYVEEVRSPKKGELAFVSMRKYQAKKSGLPNEAEASTLGSSAKISSADSESPVATNKSLAGSATSVSAGEGSDLFGNEQRKVKKSSSETKIEDVGEVLAGARKDMRREIAKSLANVTEAALVEKPFGKVYKKPDLKKAVESGALREKDAIFYEALFSRVNQQKPKVTQSEMRSKRYIPDFKTKAERWAADTFKQMEVLRHFMELDEVGRDAMMEQMLADRYPTREQELAEIEKRKGWNPDYEGHKYEWGEMTTPNPLWVTHEVMNRLGYSVGDKLDVPYGVVKANTSGTGYSIENLKGERASLFGSGMTLDEAIDRIVYLAKLKRGDADVSHPTRLFYFPATKSERGESGRYRVMWGRDYKTREFDSKEEADAFAQTKSGAYVSPIMETKRRFGYKVQFYHPLTGEKVFVDDAEFDSKEEAQAYFDGNFEKINDATNARLQKEREKKGEKKTLTADDVVHVTMVLHSGKGGWTHSVVIDKKYANNDGQVRIIKEGFASRKDANAFADSVKEDVLKTVLKHKEDAKKIVYFDTGENSRIGEDYRNGKNVDAEDFMNTFGFRGVQFGNWTDQADRQMAVNQAYDAFMDMARLIGVSPKAMSLNGELGIAFGARGVGGFAAHYEHGEVVINLTKTQGAGSLAHEWWHALDNYFARRAGSAGDMVTDNRRIEMRDALRKAFNDMLDLVNGSDYALRSADKGEYWGRTREITARLLAEWVDRELKKRGELNTFLSRGAVVERGQQHNYDVYEVLERLAGREPMPFEDYMELPESLKGIPYPSAKEVEQFGGSLRHIFDTLEEQVDEETGNVMLYEPAATYETRDGKKVVCRSLFDELGVGSGDEVAMVSQHTEQGQGHNQVIAPSEIRLRKLKKGETCHVERVYEETRQFDFTGKEKVESAEDVAYIFRQLENAAVENSFLVLVKDGRPTVIHLGVGSYVNVMAPYEQALVAYRELKPEQVYFVHNHPSGVLKASRQDQELLKRVKMAFGEDVVQQGIIIDTTSGKYGEFDLSADGWELKETSSEEEMSQSQGDEVPVKVYQFSRQVFAPDWNPESAFKIVSTQSVAEFVSSHRLGEHKKMSFLVVNNSFNVVANVFLPWTKLSDIKRSKDAGDLLAGYVHQCGGVRGILYGNYDYESDDRAVLAAVGGRMRQLNAPLMDALHVEHSANENGWAGVGEPGGDYGTDAREVAQRMDENNVPEVKIEDVVYRRVFGGNSGYVGYSKSRRAVDAENRGLRNKSQMNNEFADEVNALIQERVPGAAKVTLKQIKDSLNDMRASEWHHTSMYGNRTNYYSAETVAEYFMPETEEEKLARSRREESDVKRSQLEAERSQLRREIEEMIMDALGYEEREYWLENDYTREFPQRGKVFVTSEGDGVVVSRNVFNDAKTIDLIPFGYNEAMRPYSDWQYENYERIEDALNEYNEARRKAVENLPADKTARLRELNAEINSLNSILYRDGGHDVDFNIITSVYGKSGDSVVRWINNGRLLYVDKEKALDYISVPAPIAGAQSNQELNSAAKVVEDFENPSVLDENSSDLAEMRAVVEQLGERLHTPIRIVEDVQEIVHPDAEVQERRRGAQGWFNPATGELVVLPVNHRDVADVMATVFHEVIGHKGLRELIGAERYDEFLDEVYRHLRGDLKDGVDDAAGRAFINDTTKNGKRAKSYEQHRRTAVDELFGRMAEKPFEEFSEGERTLWQKIKATVRRLLDKFLGSLKLPKWFELGDNELRYILWRSKERLERGKEHPIDLARDIVKREELGLTDEARYNMGDAPETFKARQRRAVENRGTVMPGLNDALVKVVDVPRHPYTGSIKEASKQAIDAAKAKFVPNGEPKTLHYNNFGAEFDYSISGKALKESINPKQQEKSDSRGVHLAVAEHLDEVIGASIEVEEHPDYLKNEHGERDTRKVNADALMHRFYGAITVEGKSYRVMTLMREDRNAGNGVHAYEVTKIEVLDGQTTKPLSVSSRKSNTPNDSHGLNSELEAHDLNGRSNVSDVFVSGAKLLNNLEKSYDSGKKILDESKIADESTDLYRDPDETEDIWNDQSLGLQERITAAATRLANNHRDNKTLRNDAMRAIGGNLSDLRKAMSLQRTFDMTTVKRVADLARVLMNNGYLNGLTQQEVKRLLAAVKNSVGHNDIEGDVQKVMDIMVNNQLKHAKAALESLEAIRGSKVDARGVEVQGQLDPAGQTIVESMKEAQKIVAPCGGQTHDAKGNLTPWGIALEDVQMRMSSNDQAVADAAALEYAGMQMAQQWFDDIEASKLEEITLSKELKNAHDTTSERDRATDSYRQYIASLQEAIRQNKIERAQSYFDLVGRLSDSLRESIANAKDFKEAEKQRIREIQHNANSDMEGRPSDEHYKPTFADKFVNNSFVSFLFAPLATFDQMLRMFGGKSANGEGYLYNRFMRGWIDARQKEINGVRDKYAILDAKAAELFGGKVKTWGDLIRRVGKLPKGTVSFWNGGEMQERELTQGNLMYIYMVNKMLDGRMKLRKMGITEENVADIEEVLDPRLIELADWLQDEFLVQTRNEYNETHKRMFGASMAAIEHYFPLKILANARADKPEDLDNPDKSDGISTATGSIIKRRRNALALDITGADALSVILDHVAQMEHWNAFAEFNRDLNTLRTYKRFRNQVQNMTTIYGSGKELWKKFNDVCQMAAGTYRPPRTKLDEAAVNFAKGVTAAKVSFRMFTALKQFLSMPAYIPEARTDYLLRNIANPVGAWKWSMEHLPIFNERWRSRMSGDPRLLKSDMDWKMWRTRIMQLASRAGMSPNAFVDALTVSIGAHSMYQTRLAQYLRDGYSEADAEKKAVQDAEVLYNQTQQSSEGAFTSTMQVDRSWLSVLFTVFRNASMSYQRQLHDALRNFKHNLTPGGRARSIEFMTKQLLRDKGIEPQTDGNWSDADWQREEQVAKRKFRRQLLKDTLRVAIFGYIMQFAWNLGAYLPYLLFGDDEDEKQKMWDDVWAHTAFGSVEGLTGGDLMSQAGQMMLTGEGNPAYLSKDMPLTSDIMAAFQKLGNGQHTEALNDMINLIVQAGLGVNPQSITDVALSIMDACGDDPVLAHEATICISRILQVPQSQIDKMYFDEVGLSGDEVSKYTPAQLAERYAQFKVKRGRFFSPWSWGDEERIKKFTDKANKTIKERTEQMGDDKVNEAYLQYEEVYKGVDAKVKEAKKMAKTDYVEAAQLMADAQSDHNAFATYQMFKQLDGNFNKIVKFYLGAKTPDEAALCRQAVLDYKSAMVKVLDAPDAATRAEAMGNLGNVMQEFAQKYVPMQQPNR